MSQSRRPRNVTARLLKTIGQRLESGKHVRRVMPVWGRLHIDRQLPFLCVYRRRSRTCDEGSDRLLLGEASYLLASSRPSQRKGLSDLVEEVARRMVDVYGSFLILEVWPAASGEDEAENTSRLRGPRFRICGDRNGAISSTVERMERALLQISISRRRAEVTVDPRSRPGPPGLRPLMTAKKAREIGCHVLGLEVDPIYRHADTREVYPFILRTFRRRLGSALRRTFFEFTRSETSRRPPHYQALGRRAGVRAVWDGDRQLAVISDGFDFLLSVTPLDVASAWSRFRRSRYEKAPLFHYRPRVIEPSLLKRRLYSIPLERVEDPALAQVLYEKQDEIGRKITMIADRGTAAFMPGSLQVFGEPDDEVVSLAQDLISRLDARRQRRDKGDTLSAEQLKELALGEFSLYRASCADFAAKVEIRDDVAGVLVSRGSLLINRDLSTRRQRAHSLMQHEVGVHLVTYFNGRAQPFRQLYSGLAGYEELQEGLAVLAEYLTDGLNAGRLRILAARVLAVRWLLDGATFIDVFRKLNRDCGLERRAAFTMTMRVFRGGGLTKDAIYMRGLIRLTDYLRGGGDIVPLFVGKIGFDHISLVKELLWRKVLTPPAITPRWLDTDATSEGIKHISGTTSFTEIIQGAFK